MPSSALSNEQIQGDTVKKYTWAAFPIVFYQPETNWAFGFAGAINFRWKNQEESMKPSQVQMLFGYSLEKQVIAFLPFSLYSNTEKWWVKGEMGYYRYFYRFYGLGNQTLKENREDYRADFPQFRLNVYRLLGGNFYLGAGFGYDQMNISDLDSEGVLYRENITGYAGGRVLRGGIRAVYDSRDYIFYPAEGIYLNASIDHANSHVLSDYTFSKIHLEGVKYSRINSNTIWVNGVFFEGSTSETPFYEMALLGGPKWMRGYYEGRFRDLYSLGYQSEIRYKINRLFGLVAFAGLGNVFGDNSTSYLDSPKWTAGGGVRVQIDKKNMLNIRLDFALGKNTSGFYLTVGEAF